MLLYEIGCIIVKVVPGGEVRATYGRQILQGRIRFIHRAIW